MPIQSTQIQDAFGGSLQFVVGLDNFSAHLFNDALLSRVVPGHGGIFDPGGRPLGLDDIACMLAVFADRIVRGARACTRRC